MQPQQIVTLVIGVVFLGVLMFLPQWQAKRRRQKQMAGLDVGIKVVTIGGIIGVLTYIDTGTNRARIQIARGIEIEILPAAISGPISEQETETNETPTDE